ncbi:DASH family cryptochrome [Aliidiomarina celeris]|uniref:DASH family cryptochrome n=1 Tax=Aliidiomarina celeris TaxID=2249428 RepID=UPI000DE8A98D|nr:DASH family cryptochrome [Aliidiomarina celeris]
MTITDATRLNTQRLGIHWFRRDLRLADNAALQVHNGQPLLGVFCFDDAYAEERCSSRRKAFLWQSVLKLKRKMEAVGGQLLILAGEPEHELKSIIEVLQQQQIVLTQVTTQTLPCSDEQQQEQRVRQMLLDTCNLELHSVDSYTLWPLAEVQQCMHKPLVGYSPFRKKMEPLLSNFRAIDIETPTPQFISIAESVLYNLHSLCLTDVDPSSSLFSFYVEVGENKARTQLQRYCASNGAIRHYKDTRNGLVANANVGPWFSSKLSAWLSIGTLCVKHVMAHIFQHEQRYGANNSTYWLKLELLWREFFQHLAFQQQEKLFYGSAQRHRHLAPAQVTGSLTDWQQGTTSNAFVNAAMRELNSSGYMSNRARQNAASALIYDLALDWREGAMWFEKQLLDYDPASNYGNWQYIAGIVANSRGGSRFNLQKQQALYDAEGLFVKTWSQA